MTNMTDSLRPRCPACGRLTDRFYACSHCRLFVQWEGSDDDFLTFGHDGEEWPTVFVPRPQPQPQPTRRPQPTQRRVPKGGTRRV